MLKNNFPYDMIKKIKIKHYEKIYYRKEREDKKYDRKKF